MNTWGEGEGTSGTSQVPHIIENAVKDQRRIHAVKWL